jgi:general secretion pathway protein L
MSALIIPLPAAVTGASTEFEFALTHDGSTVARHGAAAGPLLPPPSGAGAEVVAIVPASMLSWHRVELPKGTTPRSPRLRALLEGLLEDRLLDDPESLHFAAEPQFRAEAPTWVATCDRAWLRECLLALEAAGRPVSRIVPEFAPRGEPLLYAIGEAQAPTLVAATADGVTTLPLSAAALALLPALAADTRFVSEPAVAEIAEQVLQQRPALQHPAERWVQAAQSPWDLAQFEFSRSGRARTMKRAGAMWADVRSAPQSRAARWGAIALVVLNLVGLNAWAWRERSSIDEKRDLVRRSLTQTFPNVRVVVDPPVQMEREVAALRIATGASSARDFEAMLGALAASLPPQRAATGVDYANGELRVRGLGLGAEEVRALSSTLKAQGYGATLTGDVLVVTSGAAS